jgi:hypothetical protein
VDPNVALSEAIDAFVGSDPFCYADPESIVVLERQLARLGYVVSSAVASFEAAHEFAPDGAKSATAWLTTRCHLPAAEARAQLRRGRALEVLPASAQAWSNGDIAGAHVDLMAKVRSAKSQEALARDETLLVDAAKELRFAPFVAALTYWHQHADPEGADESDISRQARRDVFLTQSIGGMYLGSMTFDAISGAIVSGELTRLEGVFFDADWAQAKAALRRDPHLDELARSAAQRRADAMVEMATRSLAVPKDARRPEPLFSILVGYEELYGRICTLEGGPVVSVGSLLSWLDRASFERIVFAPGKRIECSPTARFFTGATRRAIELRDQECTHAYCDVPAADCDIDHIVPFPGPTTQENGRVLCGFHNRLRNGRPPPGDADLE